MYPCLFHLVTACVAWLPIGNNPISHILLPNHSSRKEGPYFATAVIGRTCIPHTDFMQQPNIHPSSQFDAFGFSKTRKEGPHLATAVIGRALLIQIQSHLPQPHLFLIWPYCPFVDLEHYPQKPPTTNFLPRDQKPDDISNQKKYRSASASHGRCHSADGFVDAFAG